ncbi:MAG TPA: DUF3885 domain-containing protein [Acidobacteriaceae bacterium]|nr:DUF3885 domain-containing protein [Acidobacteriaceae bacterium]
MSVTFPGLHLRPPLFYEWPVGIRFELGTNQDGMSYDDVVLHRACTLYETVFYPGDLSYIVSGAAQYTSIRPSGIKTKSGRYRTFSGTVFQLSKRYSLGLSGPAGRYRLVTDEDEDTREITTLRWTNIEPRRIDYKRILQAKANADYYMRRPRTSDRVYFVNRTRNIILHMYDDRGLDLVAPKRSDLQAIYDAHKSWILEYDRTRIEKTFQPMAG